MSGARATIVVPTFNEAANLPELARRIRSAMAETEIVVVDDGSPDGTAARARELSLRVVERGERGLASAVLRGLDEARTDVCVVMDADLSHPPEKIPELLAPILKGEADMVIGSRYVERGGTGDWALRRKISSRIASLAVMGLTKVKDPMSGFFFLKRGVIKNVHLSPKGFKIALEILVRGKYDRVVEVPIIFQDRIYGETKLNSGVIFDYLCHIMKLYTYKIIGS